MNDRLELFNILKNYKMEHQSEFEIEKLGVFGSFARSQETDISDIDVVIRTKRPNLFRLSKIRLELESLLHKHVDIVCYRDRMNQYLKKRIDEEAIYV